MRHLVSRDANTTFCFGKKEEKTVKIPTFKRFDTFRGRFVDVHETSTHTLFSRDLKVT